ncbi:hypothetical protein FOXG_18335 [Fusarium oxysporum f. sp. lycopersici 4287]|uniref:Uncharacterized protein n=1 Tax=Fusarium oxysporum f. sp. lycopersici (strain 4287 / CBS 123668 / FGSC 9935 / NRRL 34936) TaxID=426428 RepID=A0A0J9UG15_FUSO4|nr:hypothetical protein FOXG_18335 [Fusarium oxysporum f. sp. lycopersici 4287]KNA98079.1 hypothetical protein FOXG_18335 [Fusarium oxysporum f. sp. lycopersici 4287]
MVLNNLRDTKFFDRLRIYLRRHEFQSTESHGFWGAWKKATGESITATMSAWTKEPGSPVLRAS